ncbi:hypothetical protein [Vampirovibrio sp.]|uniref:hypothetical protein n=1 Tax=Vampirovibrio sp. TaxID=2717857 RepID=UPI0035946F90
MNTTQNSSPRLASPLSVQKKALKVSSGTKKNFFYADPGNNFKSVKAKAEARSQDLSFPHYHFCPNVSALNAIGEAFDSFTPTKITNQNLNASKPIFSTTAEEAAYITDLKAKAQALNLDSVLEEAMKVPVSKKNRKLQLHTDDSTRVPSLKSLQYTAKVRDFGLQNNIEVSEHSLTRALQDGVALTFLKALKEFCHDSPDSKTVLVYDQRPDKRSGSGKVRNQLHLFRPSSATKKGVCIPLSPPNPQNVHLPKALKAKTVIAEDIAKLDKGFQNGSFVVLHTDDGLPINTNALYRSESNKDLAPKNLTACFDALDLVKPS